MGIGKDSRLAELNVVVELATSMRWFVEERVHLPGFELSRTMKARYERAERLFLDWGCEDDPTLSDTALDMAKTEYVAIITTMQWTLRIFLREGFHYLGSRIKRMEVDADLQYRLRTLRSSLDRLLHVVDLETFQIAPVAKEYILLYHEAAAIDALQAERKWALYQARQLQIQNQ